MALFSKLKSALVGKPEAEHLRRGRLGERAAKKYLQRQGLKFLTANFRSSRGEIDLIFRAADNPSQPCRNRLARRGFELIHLGWSWDRIRKSLKIHRLGVTPNTTYCLVFVEVKTRSSEQWGRPASAVDRERRKRLSRAALDYLKLLHRPPVKLRFDIVEVLLQNGVVREVRHLPNTFALEKPYRYG